MSQIAEQVKTCSLYSISETVDGVEMNNMIVGDLLPKGYSNIVPTTIKSVQYLFAYSKTDSKLDIYEVTESENSFVLKVSDYKMCDNKDWDIFDIFVLGNLNYILAYNKERGYVGIYQIYDDLSLSRVPFIYLNKRDTPTKEFTTIKVLESLGNMYLCCYDTNSGRVAAFSINIIHKSDNGSPAIRMLNVWYHHWARCWENFVFFQFGGSNFFFKINNGKLNVNIDHLQDDPANGSVEVGSHLEHQLPNALDVKLSSLVPWPNDSPHFITFNPKSETASLHEIHANCRGWTNKCETTVPDASQIVSYMINGISYVLFYNE